MNKNNHFFGFSLKTRVMLFMSAAIFLTIGVGTLLYVQNFKKNYLEAIEWRSSSLAQTIAAEMRSRYSAFDWSATSSNIDLLIETTYLQIKRLYDANTKNHVTFIAIMDQKGKIITHSDRSLIGKSIGQTGQLGAYLKQPGETVTLLVGQDYHTLIPVQFEENSPFAIIDVGFPKKIVDEKIMDIVLQALFFLVILFFTKLVLIWIYIKHDVYRPISALINVTDEIAAGNLQGSLTISGAREFSRLASSLSHMRDAIYRSFSELEHANQEIKALIACAPVALFSIDNQGHIAIWTTPAERLFGWSRDDVTDRPLPFINAEDLPRFLDLCKQVAEGKILQGKEFTLYHATKSSFSGSLSLAPIYDQDTKVTGVMVSVEDISERIERERLYHDTQIQLRQAQKMESVGRLAGGVAHDYNNMLGVILGNAELALLKMDQSDPNRRYLNEIITAAKHSAEITSQLLAFARKQTICPEIVDLNLCVDNMLKMLRRLLGETIHLNWQPQVSQCWVKMDSTQVQQILANLCINARDAMPDGGTITITTFSIVIDDPHTINEHDISSGDYICLTVRDTGIGMDETLKERAFEPFFTTKATGEGTGLGLATVYGIVKQNNGFIEVSSEPGHGTVFSIYIAEQQPPQKKIINDEAILTPDSTGKTILVVEDEEAIRDLCTQILENFGFRVLSSSDPIKALEMVRENHEKVDLLITDVIMPGINGRELSSRLKNILPQVKTLFMSGYTADVIERHEVMESHVHFIQKPFSQTELAGKLQEILVSQGEDINT